MPIIKSAAKRARQNIKRRATRLPVKSLMKSSMKKYVDLVAQGKKEDALVLLPQVFSAIDMAAKRNIIHRNNAARKKSRMSRMVSAK